jgi:hypothetical protein
MGMLNNTQLQVILDKLARWAVESVGDPEFNAGFTAGMAKANADVISGSNSVATYILGLDDEDIEADLLPAARNLDENNPSPSDGFLLTIPEMSSMITALNTHFKAHGYKGVDDYLTAQNTATPTLRAHGMFRTYLKTLSAKNSFIPNDLVLATFTETGATAGTFASLATIDKTNYAGAKLVVKNVTALTSSAVVTVTATKLDGTSATLTATLSTHTIGTETNLSDTTQLYVGVTAIAITTGTAADQFEIVAKTDRSIAAA